MAASGDAGASGSAATIFFCGDGVIVFCGDGVFGERLKNDVPRLGLR